MKDAEDKSSLELVPAVVLKHFLNWKNPWIPLSILLIGYAIQGYLLTENHQPLIVYLSIVVGYALLQLIIIHSATQQIKDTIRRWISSDAIHVIGFLVIVFLASFVLSYLEIFENLLLVLAAEILARLELQQTNLNSVQKFLILSLCLTIGLATGWITNQLLT